MATQTKKQLSSRNEKKLNTLREEIIAYHKDPELRDFKLNLLNAVGWGPYTSWFADKKIHLRSGWFVIVIDNEWAKGKIKKEFFPILKKLKVILQVGD
jgi:hypothetical protein